MSIHSIPWSIDSNLELYRLHDQLITLGGEFAALRRSWGGQLVADGHSGSHCCFPTHPKRCLLLAPTSKTGESSLQLLQLARSVGLRTVRSVGDEATRWRKWDLPPTWPWGRLSGRCVPCSLHSSRNAFHVLQLLSLIHISEPTRPS